MVNVYAVNCAALMDEAALTKALTRLDTIRTAQIKRNRHTQKRAQKAAAGLLLNHLFGDNRQPPHLTHSSRGKPYLADNRAFFSLSHTGNWVICAVAHNEVGADAQTHGDYNERVAARYFTPREIAWLNDDRNGRFSRLWTYKEAYVKFTGLGLMLPTNSFTVPTPPDGWDDTNHVCWKEYTIDNNTVHITVCCGEQSDFAPLQLLDLADIL